MATRIRFVVKIERFLPQIGDEIRPRRQKTAFLSSNWRREYVSSSKLGLSCLKTTTRFGFVIKNWLSSPQIGDEIRSRRQKTAFPAPNWRREGVSSSKIGRFLPQNGDENRPRRQKMKFPDQKR
ncbi:hypothetical protein P9386_00890 [Caldifermentibacillus hisashii]|uniref:hypothetical protein n=1 Tax=Caldifermentibacillus hisashii TaxID=996558 RepID=UPI002E1D48E3|nr:hypothetical protein [Caldifermentibacillus hisashii]